MEHVISLSPSATHLEKKSKNVSRFFEFRSGINFFHFCLRCFEEVKERLGSPGVQAWRVKEGTFLHPPEKSRALSDQYFRRYEFFNLFLFFTFSVFFPKIIIFHQSQLWALHNNKKESKN